MQRPPKWGMILKVYGIKCLWMHNDIPLWVGDTGRHFASPFLLNFFFFPPTNSLHTNTHSHSHRQSHLHTQTYLSQYRCQGITTQGKPTYSLPGYVQTTKGKESHKVQWSNFWHECCYCECGKSSLIHPYFDVQSLSRHSTATLTVWISISVLHQSMWP